jgi:hypothetical protein
VKEKACELTITSFCVIVAIFLGDCYKMCAHSKLKNTQRNTCILHPWSTLNFEQLINVIENFSLVHCFQEN